MGRVRILGKKSFFEKSYGFSETSPFYFLKTQGHLRFDLCLLSFQVKLVQWVWIGRSPDFDAPYIGGYLGIE